MFQIRDLLIVAALIVGGMVVAYRSTIKQYCEPAVKPVQYYVDAPERERALRDEIARLEGAVQGLVDEMASQLAKHATEISQQNQLIDAAQATIERLDADLLAERRSFAGLKTRYAALCQRLLELGNDVPSALAAE